MLNLTSIKKRDNMLAYVRGQDGVVVPGPIDTGVGFQSLFMPTARTRAPTAAGEATRDRQTTFSVGYKERVQIDVSGGGVWKWRRVVFTYKGDALYTDPNSEWNAPFHDKATSPRGSDMTRVINQPTTAQATAIRGVIWDGEEQIDWYSELTAKVDTKRITPLYDRTVTFNPRNESGLSRTFRLWHRTRRNLVYADDEAGGAPDAPGAYTSVDGKPGMGDLYIYDVVQLIVPAAGGTAGLRFDPQGTYYWHER